MARSFPGGAADTDKLTVTRYAEINNLATLSVAVWTYRTGEGGAAVGRMVQKANGFFVYNGGGDPEGYRFQAARWSTTGGDWKTTTAPIRPAANQWHLVVCTYSYSSTANVPSVYFDGALQTVSATASPAGTNTLDDSGQDVLIGNAPANNRCWAGRLAEVAIWNRVLTADEVRYLVAVAPNAPQSGGALATGLVLYLPITGTTSPEPNPAKPANTGAVTGTTNVASPALFVPSGGGSGTKLYLGSTAVYPA